MVDKNKAPSHVNVYIKPITGRVQRAKCPFCGRSVKTQYVYSGIMSGWNDCAHVYAGTNDQATNPGLVFRRTPTFNR